MKVGVDFDRVLFDTDAFKKELNRHFPRFNETYAEANRDGYYNLEKHAELLEVEESEIIETMRDSADYLYGDVEKLSDLQYEVVIVTRGDPVIQKEKMEESGVLDYVDDYFIVQEDSKDVGGIDFLIDDRKVEIEEADLPGFVLDREKDSLEDAVEAVREYEA
jgi:FMN phosphatase YigB (HAD superfamily)